MDAFNPIAPYTFPSEKQVTENLELWESYASNLTDICCRVADQNKKKQVVEAKILKMFQKYVAPAYPHKKYNNAGLLIVQENKYEYNYDRVVITYFGRIVWLGRKTMWAVDEFISVDGKIIRNKKKM
jgi:hypothetical protein